MTTIATIPSTIDSIIGKLNQATNCTDSEPRKDQAARAEKADHHR